MSLRSDIHSAIEVITPPLGGMPERVVQTVLAEENRRRRKEGMVYRMHAPLTVAAALIVVAVIGAALFTWNAVHTVSTSGHVGQTAVQQLEGRNLNLAVLAGEPCPLTPLKAQAWGGQSGIYGAPPAGVAKAGFSFSNGWGRYWDMFAVTTANLTGPVLLRGRDLQTGQDMIFVGKWAYGPVVGTDQWDGPNVSQHRDLVLDPSKPPHEDAGPGLAKWSFVAGVARGASGCLGLQLDGADFTETVVLAG